MDHAPVADRPQLAPVPLPGAPAERVEPALDPALAAAVEADRAAIAGLAALAAPAARPAPATVTAVPAVVRADVRHLADPGSVGPSPTDRALDDAAPDAPAPADAARCPIPGVGALGTSCPVRPGAATGPVHRSAADLFVRRLLRIRERPPGVTSASAYATFQRSMLISATRCTLTYVVFPFVLPGIGFLKGVGPVIGVLIGSLALACDTFTIRRFFAVDHKYRWYFSGIAFAIMGLLSILLVQDVAHLVGTVGA